MDHKISFIHRRIDKLTSLRLLLEKDCLLNILEKHNVNDLLPSLLYTACCYPAKALSNSWLIFFLFKSTGGRLDTYFLNIHYWKKTNKADKKSITSCVKLIRELFEMKQDPFTAITVYTSSFCGDLKKYLLRYQNKHASVHFHLILQFF